MSDDDAPSRCRVQLERELEHVNAALQRYYSVTSRATTTNEIDTQIRRAIRRMGMRLILFLGGGGPRSIPSCFFLSVPKTIKQIPREITGRDDSNDNRLVIRQIFTAVMHQSCPEVRLQARRIWYYSMPLD